MWFEEVEWVQLARDSVTVMTCDQQCNDPLGHVKMRGCNDCQLVKQDYAVWSYNIIFKWGGDTNFPKI